LAEFGNAHLPVIHQTPSSTISHLRHEEERVESGRSVICPPEKHFIVNGHSPNAYLTVS
jgi:hypothetical protein